MKKINNHIIVKCASAHYANDWLETFNNFTEAVNNSKIRGIWSPAKVILESKLNFNHEAVTMIEKDNFLFVILNLNSITQDLSNLTRMSTAEVFAIMTNSNDKPHKVSIKYCNSNEASEEFTYEEDNLDLFYDHIIDNLLSDSKRVSVQDRFGKSIEKTLMGIIDYEQREELIRLMRNRGWEKDHELMIVDALEYIFQTRYHSNYPVNSEEGFSWFKWVIEQDKQRGKGSPYIIKVSSKENPLLCIADNDISYYVTVTGNSNAYFGTDTMVTLVNHNDTFEKEFPNDSGKDVREYMHRFTKLLAIVNHPDFKEEYLSDVNSESDLRKFISVYGIQYGVFK